MSFLLITANVLGAAVTWLILLAVGARMRRWCRIPVGGSLRWSVDVALGAWVASIVLLAVSLAGFVSWLPMLATVGCLACIGRWTTRRPLAPLLFAAAGGLLYLPVALGPPFFYDALVYHLGLPWQALMEGGLHAHPENLFSTFPPLAQLLSLPSLSLGLYRAPALLHWLVFLTAATAVFGLARRFGAPRGLAGLAAAGALVIPTTPLVPGFPAAEAWLLVSLMPAVALAAGPCRWGSGALAGLLAGVATAARLQGIPWSVLVVLLVSIRCRGKVRVVGVTLGCWLAGALPWWGKNLLLLGDPTAPVFWNREGMETLWRDSESMLKLGASVPEASAAIARLLAPELGWLIPLVLVGLLAAANSKRKLLLAGTVVFGLMAWAATGALPRFLTPTVCILLALVATPGKERIRRLAAGAAIVWCILIGAQRGVDSLRAIQARELVALDFRDAAEILVRNSPMAAFAEADALPPRALVLFVAEPRMFGFPRPSVTPSQHDVQPIRALIESSRTIDQVMSELQTRGITHLLVNWHELDNLGGAYPVAPWKSPAGQKKWTGFLASLGPSVIQNSGVEIYQLPP